MIPTPVRRPLVQVENHEVHRGPGDGRRLSREPSREPGRCCCFGRIRGSVLGVRHRRCADAERRAEEAVDEAEEAGARQHHPAAGVVLHSVGGRLAPHQRHVVPHGVHAVLEAQEQRAPRHHLRAEAQPARARSGRGRLHEDGPLQRVRQAPDVVRLSGRPALAAAQPDGLVHALHLAPLAVRGGVAGRLVEAGVVRAAVRDLAETPAREHRRVPPRHCRRRRSPRRGLRDAAAAEGADAAPVPALDREGLHHGAHV
mmetsp:Transcript_10781/g.35407  ORF Transcript_10781/g.35407 Transcript_10781/m.35407 type:complete len:257 (+) Transcript_10781:1355-2125(+)